MTYKFNEWLVETNNDIKYLTVYHGTNNKHVEDIKTNGLISNNYNQSGWYMVSTDFESALFHSTISDGEKFAYVFEFKIPLDENERWLGYPYLWVPYIRNENSSWFALKQKIPSEYITKIHKVVYDEWLERKQLKY